MASVRIWAAAVQILAPSAGSRRGAMAPSPRANSSRTMGSVLRAIAAVSTRATSLTVAGDEYSHREQARARLVCCSGVAGADRRARSSASVFSRRAGSSPRAAWKVSSARLSNCLQVAGVRVSSSRKTRMTGLFRRPVSSQNVSISYAVSGSSRLPAIGPRRAFARTARSSLRVASAASRSRSARAASAVARSASSRSRSAASSAFFRCASASRACFRASSPNPSATAEPTTRARNTAEAAPETSLFRFTHLYPRSSGPAVRAVTGAPSRNRRRSSASARQSE